MKEAMIKKVGLTYGIQEVGLHVHLGLVDKKLFKSSKVRKWLKETEKAVNQKLKEQDALSKISESIVLGVPISLYSDGSIKVLKDFYKKRRRKDKNIT